MANPFDWHSKNASIGIMDKHFDWHYVKAFDWNSERPFRLAPWAKPFNWHAKGSFDLALCQGSFDRHVNHVLRLAWTRSFDWRSKGLFDWYFNKYPSIDVWTRAIWRTPSRPFERGHQEGTQKTCPGTLNMRKWHVSLANIEIIKCWLWI